MVSRGEWSEKSWSVDLMDSRVKMGFRDYLVDFIFIRKIMRITITAAMCEFTYSIHFVGSYWLSCFTWIFLLYIALSSFLTIYLGDQCYYCVHFVDEETKALKSAIQWGGKIGIWTQGYIFSTALILLWVFREGYWLWGKSWCMHFGCVELEVLMRPPGRRVEFGG